MVSQIAFDHTSAEGWIARGGKGREKFAKDAVSNILDVLMEAFVVGGIPDETGSLQPFGRSPEDLEGGELLPNGEPKGYHC